MCVLTSCIHTFFLFFFFFFTWRSRVCVCVFDCVCTHVSERGGGWGVGWNMYLTSCDFTCGVLLHLLLCPCVDTFFLLASSSSSSGACARTCMCGCVLGCACICVCEWWGGEHVPDTSVTIPAKHDYQVIKSQTITANPDPRLVFKSWHTAVH